MPKFNARLEEYFVYQNMHRQGGKNSAGSKRKNAFQTKERVRKETARRIARQAIAPKIDPNAF